MPHRARLTRLCGSVYWKPPLQDLKMLKAVVNLSVVSANILLSAFTGFSKIVAVAVSSKPQTVATRLHLCSEVTCSAKVMPLTQCSGSIYIQRKTQSFAQRAAGNHFMALNAQCGGLASL